MAWHNIHTRPFNGSYRDVALLLRAYQIPILVLAMIACFAVGFTAFHLSAITSLRQLQESTMVELSLFARLGVPCYLLLGDALFAVLFWSFFRSMLTCAGFVPNEPWRHAPRTDPVEQRQIAEQWTKLQGWLEWERYQQAMLQYQRHARLIQQLTGVSAPPMHVQPPTQPAPAGSGLPLSPSHVGECQQPAERQEALEVSRTSESAPPTGRGEGECHVAVAERRLTEERRAGGDGPHARAEGPHGAVAVQEVSAGVNAFVVHELEADGSLRYCHPCGQFKPDRSRHCRNCNRCVALMDHHCIFLGSCVGLRNYKFFFLTISYGTACGWFCSAMFLHVYALMRRIHAALSHSLVEARHSLLGHDEYVRLRDALEAGRYGSSYSHWWLLTPVGMLLVNVLVFYLWARHVDLLWRGMTTLERMRQASVERFMRNMDVQRYGRCAPQTNRFCAMLADAKERARCMFQRVDSSMQDEDAEHAKMMAREERETATAANGGLDYAYGPNLLGGRRDGAMSPSESSTTPGSGCRGATAISLAEKRSHHFRRLFGFPRYWWHHLLPLSPRCTGEQPGEVEHSTQQAKSV